jgi:hypothetical protein
LFVKGAGHTQGEQSGSLRLDGEVGEHVRHQGLIDQRPPERTPVTRVVHGFDQRPPHQRRRAHHAIQPRVVYHFEDHGDTPAFFSDPLRPRAMKLHFARRIRTVSQLRFQALEMKRVGLPVRRPAR